MVRMQPRHKVPKALSSIPVLIVMVLVSLSLLVGVIQMASKTRVTSAQAREASNELEMLEAEHSKLVADIASLETDAGKIEALRNNYRAGTEGEKLVVIVKEDTDEEGDDSKQGSIGRFFTGLFGGGK